MSKRATRGERAGQRGRVSPSRVAGGGAVQGGPWRAVISCTARPAGRPGWRTPASHPPLHRWTAAGLGRHPPSLLLRLIAFICRK